MTRTHEYINHAARRRGLSAGAAAFLVIATLSSVVPARSVAARAPQQADSATSTAPAGEPTDPRRARYAALLQKKFLLERERDLKRLRLALAEDDAPYLLVDLAAREIQIVVRTTTVKTVPLFTVEVEGPRRLFSAVDPPPDWVKQAYVLVGKSGVSVPAGRVTRGTSPLGDADVTPRAVTPAMLGLDESDDFPTRYTLLFQHGVAVDVRATERTPDEKSWIERSVDAVGGALSAPELPDVPDLDPVRVWVHLGLDVAEAQDLYPSLFTGMRAMFRMPGDPRL